MIKMIMVRWWRISLINLTGGASVWALPHCEDIHHTLYSGRHMVPIGPGASCTHPHNISPKLYHHCIGGSLDYIDRCDHFWLSLSQESNGRRPDVILISSLFIFCPHFWRNHGSPDNQALSCFWNIGSIKIIALGSTDNELSQRKCHLLDFVYFADLESSDKIR